MSFYYHSIKMFCWDVSNIIHMQTPPPPPQKKREWKSNTYYYRQWITSNVFQNPEACSVYLYNQNRLYKLKVMMNLCLEKVLWLQTLLHIKNLMHFNSVIYIDKTDIAAISRLLKYNWAFITLSRYIYIQALFTCY